MDYLRCRDCRFKPHAGLLVRKGHGDNCVLCNQPIQEHEEHKARERYEKDRLKRIGVIK